MFTLNVKHLKTNVQNLPKHVSIHIQSLYNNFIMSRKCKAYVQTLAYTCYKTMYYWALT